ncbi:MAG: Uma2 family endonuclease [Pirellulaceae bacterium]
MGEETVKGVMLEVPEHILEERRLSGADRWDEVWDGVLHMNPPPNVEHQDFEWQLETWLRQFWIPAGSGNKVYHQVALSPDDNWVHNYRTPNVVLFRPEHLRFLRPTYCHGPCTVAIEIRSPGDETYEKLDFYAQLGVPELWVIDRDTRKPELHVLKDNSYHLQASDADGVLRSEATGVILSHAGKLLTLQVSDRAESSRSLLE